MTCVFVSHDQRDALAISDRVAVMNRGRVEQAGSPREIYKHPESVFVATFVGRTNLLQGIVRSPDGCVLTDFGSFCRVDRVGLPTARRSWSPCGRTASNRPTKACFAAGC
jgi:ABC-type Fe3+/spermidine/putrescine transport system ATPase subunit